MDDSTGKNSFESENKFGMRTSTDVTEIYNAIIKTQSEISNAKRNSNNPHFGSAYADLSSIIDVSKKPMSDNGLGIIQMPSTIGKTVSVTTRIIHTSGQWIEGEISFELTKTDPQSIGSTITYGRRYSWQSLLGFTQEGEDDDGNRGSGRDNKNQSNSKQNSNNEKKSEGGGGASTTLSKKEIEDWRKTLFSKDRKKEITELTAKSYAGYKKWLGQFRKVMTPEEHEEFKVLLDKQKAFIDEAAKNEKDEGRMTA